MRSAVANTDDPTMPCNTLRAWVIGMSAAIIIPGLNQFMYFRWPAVSVGQVSPIILSIFIISNDEIFIALFL